MTKAKEKPEEAKPSAPVQGSAESVKFADGSVGRRCRVQRSGSLQGEVAIVAEEAGGRVRAKLCAPVFANDPGVWFGPDEYELIS